MPTTASGIYYSLRGDGPLLLFVHGSGTDHLIWGYQTQVLSDEFRVVALDLNCHGKSPKRDGDGLESYTQDVIEVLEALAQPAMLLGHSLGGAIALRVALQRPELLSALGLIGTGARLKVLPELLELIESDFVASAKRILELEFYQRPSEKIWDASLQQILNNGQAAFSRDFNACNGFDVIDQLETITLPALVLCGREDKLTPVNYSEFLKNNIENAAIEIIDNAGHNVMIERPDEVNFSIRDFMTGL